MKNHSDPERLEDLQEKLAGLGESSVRKTYYPALQQRMEELERFKAFLDHSNDAFFLVEVPSGRIVDVNESATVRMGWNREELVEATLFEISDLARSPEGEGLIRLERAEERAQALTLLHRKGGGSFPAEVTLNRMEFRDKTYVLAVARDITERKKAEDALRQNEIFLKNVVENIPAMVFAKEAPDFRYVTFNRAAEELLGYAREDLLGRRDHDFFPPEQADFFMLNDRATLEKGELLYIPEETVKTRSGNDLILRTKKIPLYDEDGKARYILGIAEDVTERKRLEEQLLQSQKMDALGQLAGGVAHDFNNILMVIMGYAELLTKDPELGPAQRERVTQIMESSERASQLTKSLLAFSRKQQMKARTVDLNEVVQGVQRFLGRIIGEDIRLKASVCHNPLYALVDAGQMEQVLVNLAANARDAMPKGGTLTISMAQQAVDDFFKEMTGLRAGGHYAVITVSDTGVGMDERTRQKIFEPFFTTKEMGKGTGLGMSIVYGIIKQHNGFINVYSEPGLGTTFRIYLPLVEELTAQDQEDLDRVGVRGGSETILVAEDDPAVRRLLEIVLTSSGYPVILAQDGAEAVEKFREARGKVDLAIVDMIMPRMSGLEAGDAIRALDPAVRVIYTSGHTRDIIGARDLLRDGTELVMKPVQPHELLRKVRETLDRTAMNNEQ